MYRKENRTRSYVGTFSTSDQGDQTRLQQLIESVSLLNKTDGFGYYPSGEKIQMRVCKRGRKAITKMIAEPTYYGYGGSKGPVNYNYFGNIVGGIKNASEVDVYLYHRSS